MSTTGNVTIPNTCAGIDTIHKVAVGRRNDVGYSRDLYVEHIEGVVNVLKGDALVQVVKTIRENWVGPDAEKFINYMVQRIDEVVTTKKNDNIAKFMEGVSTNNELFKSEQSKVEL